MKAWELKNDDKVSEKKMKKPIKKTIVFIVIALAILFFIKVCFDIVTEKMFLDAGAEKGKATISKYLLEKFGEENFSKMNIELDYYNDGKAFLSGDAPPTWDYKISSHLIQGEFNIKLDKNNETIVSEIIDPYLISEYNLEKEWEKIVYNDIPELPENVKMIGTVADFNSNKFYRDDYTLEEMLKRSGYKILRFEIQIDDYDENTVIEFLKNLFLRYEKFLKKYNSENVLEILITRKEGMSVIPGKIKRIDYNIIDVEINSFFDDAGNRVKGVKKEIKVK